MLEISTTAPCGPRGDRPPEVYGAPLTLTVPPNSPSRPPLLERVTTQTARAGAGSVALYAITNLSPGEVWYPVADLPPVVGPATLAILEVPHEA